MFSPESAAICIHACFDEEYPDSVDNTNAAKDVSTEATAKIQLIYDVCFDRCI